MGNGGITPDVLVGIFYLSYEQPVVTASHRTNHIFQLVVVFKATWLTNQIPKIKASLFTQGIHIYTSFN